VPRQLLESYNLELLYGSENVTLVLLGFSDVQQENSYSNVSEVPVSGCHDVVGWVRTDARLAPRVLGDASPRRFRLHEHMRLRLL
jgi:hypothetical protein